MTGQWNKIKWWCESQNLVIKAAFEQLNYHDDDDHNSTSEHGHEADTKLGLRSGLVGGDRQNALAI